LEGSGSATLPLSGVFAENKGLGLLHSGFDPKYKAVVYEIQPQKPGFVSRSKCSTVDQDYCLLTDAQNAS
jgi:hypothetical protein